MEIRPKIVLLFVDKYSTNLFNMLAGLIIQSSSLIKTRRPLITQRTCQHLSVSGIKSERIWRRFIHSLSRCPSAAAADASGKPLWMKAGVLPLWDWDQLSLLLTHLRYEPATHLETLFLIPAASFSLQKNVLHCLNRAILHYSSGSSHRKVSRPNWKFPTWTFLLTCYLSCRFAADQLVWAKLEPSSDSKYLGMQRRTWSTQWLEGVHLLWLLFKSTSWLLRHCGSSFWYNSANPSCAVILKRTRVVL